MANITKSTFSDLTGFNVIGSRQWSATGNTQSTTSGSGTVGFLISSASPNLDGTLSVKYTSADVASGDFDANQVVVRYVDQTHFISFYVRPQSSPWSNPQWLKVSKDNQDKDLGINIPLYDVSGNLIPSLGGTVSIPQTGIISVSTTQSNQYTVKIQDGSSAFLCSGTWIDNSSTSATAGKVGFYHDAEWDSWFATSADGWSYLYWTDSSATYPPSINYFKSSRNPIENGTSATVSWSINAGGATTSAWFNGVYTSGVVSSAVYPTVDTTYTLSASNINGSTSATLPINVVTNPAVINYFTSTTPVCSGSNYIISWSTSNAVSANISNIGNGLPTTSAYTTSSNIDKVYILSAYSPLGTLTSAVVSADVYTYTPVVSATYTSANTVLTSGQTVIVTSVSGLPVVVNTSGSYDLDNHPYLIYKYYQNNVLVASGNDLKTNTYYITSGLNTLRTVISDTCGYTASANFSVSANRQVPPYVRISPDLNTTIQSPTTFTLKAVDSVLERSITNYEWHTVVHGYDTILPYNSSTINLTVSDSTYVYLKYTDSTSATLVSQTIYVGYDDSIYKLRSIPDYAITANSADPSIVSVSVDASKSYYENNVATITNYIWDLSSLSANLIVSAATYTVPSISATGTYPVSLNLKASNGVESYDYFNIKVQEVPVVDAWLSVSGTSYPTSATINVSYPNQYANVILSATCYNYPTSAVTFNWFEVTSASTVPIGISSAISYNLLKETVSGYPKYKCLVKVTSGNCYGESNTVTPYVHFKANDLLINSFTANPYTINTSGTSGTTIISWNTSGASSVSINQDGTVTSGIGSGTRTLNITSAQDIILTITSGSCTKTKAIRVGFNKNASSCKTKDLYVQIWGSDVQRYSTDRLINLQKIMNPRFQTSDIEQIVIFLENYVNSMYTGDNGVYNQYTDITSSANYTSANILNGNFYSYNL